ncbi:DUF397 domain-containing protein [Streptomyces sp. WAC07149]|uniref:DUF397 domain-containing protein n=1 Tax=Streptomyces sp. WAC07149 TaxID=2487425 RepID=UPI00163C56FA|nr:DUF397 domain-containing protein [Streptomyces sp. WAC07149]
MIHNPGLVWFKSSYSSGSEGDSCVEVAHAWQKSSYSDSSEGDDCVEVASTPTRIHVRDSKDTALPHLTFGPTAWTGFLAAQ